MKRDYRYPKTTLLIYCDNVVSKRFRLKVVVRGKGAAFSFAFSSQTRLCIVFDRSVS